MGAWRLFLAAAAVVVAKAPTRGLPHLSTFALTSIDPDTGAQNGAYITLEPSSGVHSVGTPLSVGAPLAPCATALMPGGTIVIPANFTHLVFVSAATGAVLGAPLPLQPPYELPFLKYNARDGLLYSIGSSVNTPAPYLELVSVNASTGVVSSVTMVLTDNVLECAASFDAASGMLAFSYTGPLQLQALAGVVLDDATPAQPFDALTSNGSVLALATLPRGSSDASTPGVLYLSTDAIGSMWALMLLDALSGNATALAPLPSRSLVAPSQGALVYDESSRTAFALAQFVNESIGNVDVLLSFNLSGFSWAGGRPSLPHDGEGAVSYVVLDDATLAPQGLWGLAVLG